MENDVTNIKIKSQNLTVFPATRRKNYPYNSRLITEENVAKYMQMYGDKDSYVIDSSVEPRENPTKITCKFILKGHYFEISDNEFNKKCNYVCVKFQGNELAISDIVDGEDKIVSGIEFVTSDNATNSYDSTTDVTIASIQIQGEDLNYTRYSSKHMDAFNTIYKKTEEGKIEGEKTELDKIHLPSDVFYHRDSKNPLIREVDGGEI